jgi:hypothetical protein
MMEKLRFLGLDVHAETITVAVAEADGEVRSLGTIANREESIRCLRCFSPWRPLLVLLQTSRSRAESGSPT